MAMTLKGIKLFLLIIVTIPGARRVSQGGAVKIYENRLRCTKNLIENEVEMHEQ